MFYFSMLRNNIEWMNYIIHIYKSSTYISGQLLKNSYNLSARDVQFLAVFEVLKSFVKSFGEQSLRSL